MKRKEFIKTCGFGCLGATSIGMILQSCVTAKSISAAISGDNLVLNKADFLNNEEIVKYVIVRNEQLEYPIYVFRFSDTEYSASYLRCTHQGNEVNAYGEKLVCSAHGSEFDHNGNVTKGPATKPLRSLPIEIENQNILISLKTV